MAEEVLVVVHPGSACGSADMNLGRMDARAARDALAFELDRWQGPVVVIHGEFSDELPSYPMLGQAVSNVVARARQAGHRADEILGDDNSDHNQVAAITEWLEANVGADRPAFRVTGAWYHPEDGGGCVGSVLDQLRALGHEAIVADSVVELCSESEDDELDDEEEAIAPVPPPKPIRRRLR